MLETGNLIPPMKCKIYTTTKGRKEDTLLFKSLNDTIHLEKHYEEYNTRSLQECYNSFLRDARDNAVDIAVFVHDDVYINTADLLSRLVSASKKFTVFGLAGAVTCRIKKPAMWHLMSLIQEQRGCVAHGTPEKYQYTSFGPLPDRVLLIDGVFIGINISELPTNVQFDEKYPSKFHYYDLDFSLECNKNKVKMGVVDIPIIHKSPGLTNPNEEFFKGEEYFIKKWKQ